MPVDGNSIGARLSIYRLGAKMKIPKPEVNDFTRLLFNCPVCRAKTQFQIAWKPASAVSIVRSTGTSRAMS